MLIKQLLRLPRLLAAAIVSCAVAGCGGPKIVPVEGVVTLDGKPLAKAHITLQRSTGDIKERIFSGKTDDQGRYTVTQYGKSSPGATPGSYTVFISTVDVEGANELTVLPPEIVPPAYRDGSQALEVPAEGLPAANFDMKSR